MRKYIIGALTAILLASCGGEYKYPQDKGISNKEGALEDSIQEYLLPQIEYDGATYSFAWNKERLDELNEYLKLTFEPALYNYYLGRNIYRLVLVEKGKEPLLFSINRSDKDSWVSSKKLEQIVLSLSKSEEELPSDLSSSFENYYRELEMEEVQKFDSLFIATDFFHLTSEDAVKELYDSYCLIEVHEEKKYWYIYRSLDDELLKELLQYIRNLSRF